MSKKVTFKDFCYKVEACPKHGLINGNYGAFGSETAAIPFYLCNECHTYYTNNHSEKMGKRRPHKIRKGYFIENAITPIKEPSAIYPLNKICHCDNNSIDYYPFSGIVMKSGELLKIKGRRCNRCKKVFVPLKDYEAFSNKFTDSHNQSSQLSSLPLSPENSNVETNNTIQDEYHEDALSCIANEEESTKDNVIITVDANHKIANKVASAYYDAKISFNPYQYLPWLKMFIDKKKNILISDEVGLGKTIEAGILITEELTENVNAKILVICPAFLREKWYLELKEKFLMDSQVFDGKNLVDPYSHVMILPLSRLSKYLESTRHIDFSMVVIDEIHYFKNSKSKRYKYLFNILEQVPNAKKVFMSATPINNSGNDYVSIHKLFKSEHERTNTTKKQAFITLPERHLKDIYIDLTEEEQKFYNTTDALDPFSGTIYRHIGSSCLYALSKYAFRDDNMPSETKEELRTSMEILMDDMEMKNDSFEYFNVLSAQPVPETDSKLNRLFSILDNYENGTKVVIFSHYIETVKYLQSSLNRKYKAAYLYANHLSSNIACKHPKDKFLDAKEWFTNSNANTIILVCSDTCREGIDLDVAHVLINYDLPFNPSILEQRIGRVDRMSQKSDMDIYNFHVNNTYDDRLHFILSTKLRFINYFAEYGIGNQLNIRESGETALTNFLRYFKKSKFQNNNALMSNDDFSTASRLLRKVGIKFKIDDKMSSLEIQSHLIMLLERNENLIVEWFSKGELQQITDEELIKQKNTLIRILNFPQKIRRKIEINEQIRENIVDKANSNVYFRKKISGLIKDYNEKLNMMELTGEPMIIEQNDIDESYTFGTDSDCTFIPNSVIELMRNEGAIIYEI